ncbi:NAD(P)-dependent glycerol-3-phosphate dehydrogenase [Candidatus Poribacteria bacterium]|nr:NAD(P)-dependent glycerol-3-phosphate dehydrogenase [Candidatus Poribacteria bacterium]
MNPPNPETITVLGAGAWGATLADLLASKGLAVRLWDHAPGVLDRLAETGSPFGVPELKLNKSVCLERDFQTAIMHADVVVFVIPSQAVAGLAAGIAGLLADRVTMPLFVLASKGIDLTSLRTLSEVVSHAFPGSDVGVLSGPCIAREVAQGIPTSVVAACANPEVAVRIRGLFAARNLRIYTQGDVPGVELGGALKNIIAIAAGIGDGLGFAANTKSALMTRGLAEMSRLSIALGAGEKTLFGLAGLGDLAVTCFSPHSRNRTFGERLGSGMTAAEARAAIGMTVEGEPTARAALQLAARVGVDLPITEAVVRVCDGAWTARQAVESLMRRELRNEFGPRQGQERE